MTSLAKQSSKCGPSVGKWTSGITWVSTQETLECTSDNGCQMFCILLYDSFFVPVNPQCSSIKAWPLLAGFYCLWRLTLLQDFVNKCLHEYTVCLRWTAIQHNNNSKITCALNSVNLKYIRNRIATMCGNRLYRMNHVNESSVDAGITVQDENIGIRRKRSRVARATVCSTQIWWKLASGIFEWAGRALVSGLQFLLNGSKYIRPLTD